jgi:glutaredoxin-related protein
MTEISTIIETYEDILPIFSLSLNLKSYMFNKLQKNSGANWDNTKFKDYFQIKCLEINNLTVIILSQN